MSARKLIMLSLALVIGVATFMGFRSSMTPTTTPAGTAVPVEATQVLAASHDMPMGTILKDGDMKWIPWAEKAQSSRLYFKGQTEVSSLMGAVLREGMRADEPIIMGRVVQAHEQGFLAAVLNPGMRALSVTLTPSAGVAGFIFPGDRVDVILTHGFTTKNDKGEPDQTERRLSETVITNARVLALDQKSDDQATEPKVAQLATLEVSPKQAERLVLAADMASQNGGGRGTISLVLRSIANENDKAAPTNDSEHSPTMDSDLSPAFTHITPMQKIEIMRGKEVTETVFHARKEEP